MKQIPLVRYFAPYMYLVNNPDIAGGGYSLFVCIYRKAMTKVFYVGNAGDKFQFRIMDDETNATDTWYYHTKIDVPAISILSVPGVTEKRTIMVEVIHASTILDADTKSTYKISMDVDDADIKPVPSGDIALNRPYLYLTNPDADINQEDDINDIISYAPRCHVPLENGWTLSHTKSTKTTDGIFIEEISLVEGGNESNDAIDPNSIQSNSQSYEDTGRKNGYYTVLVFENNTSAAALASPPLKPKVNNQSSDDNPNGFII